MESLVDTFERKALFTITRAVALVCVIVFLIAIAGVAVYGATAWRREVPTTVSPEEILAQVKPPVPAVQRPSGALPPTNLGPQRSPLYGYKIPFSLQNYVSGESGLSLKKALDTVPADERQAFIDELGAVVAAAEANKVDVGDAVGAYVQTKVQRMQEAASERERRETMLKEVVAGVGGGLLLIALFSLVLVLLAIERNTRPATGRDAG